MPESKQLTSLDYEKKLYPLHCQIMAQNRNRNELFQMLQTIEEANHQLSRFEVILRQNPTAHSKQKCAEQSGKIDELIDHLEQYLTFAVLLK